MKNRWTIFVQASVCVLFLWAFPAMAESADELSTPTSTEKEVEQLRQQVEELTRMVEHLQQKVNAVATAPPARTSGDAKSLITSEVPLGYYSDGLPEAKQTDLTIFNPEISAAMDFIGSYSFGSENLNFIGRDLEIMLQSNVDQLAHAYLVFNAETELDPWEKTDPFDDVELGIEEAAVETTSLPYGLGLKGGVFFADFSRLGKVHSHELPFTDRPASLEEILGGETRSKGVELSWVPPVNHYFRLTAGVVDNIGAESPVTNALGMLDGEEAGLFAEKDRRSLGSLMTYGRLATVVEMGDHVLLNLGTNYARGGDAGRRDLFGADFKLTWTPDLSGYDSLVLGGEFLRGRTKGTFSDDAQFAGGTAQGTSSADGAYVYAQYNLGKKWSLGTRYDWLRPDMWEQTDHSGLGVVDGLERSRASQHMLSAYLTHHFSEFNHLRIGIGYVEGFDGEYGGRDNDWVGFLQWTTVIGPHKHSFQP